MRLNRILCLLILCVLFFSCNQTQIIDVENRKTSDYLILMYMSSDANNGDNFLPSIQQAENALTYIRNEDGSPKDGYNSVTVLALWDGPNYDTQELYSVHGSSDTRLLELGCGAHTDNDNINSGFYYLYEKADWCFSSETIDLSSKAPWLFSNGKQEINMGSYETLDNFLKFASTYYKGNTTILTFGDNGGGSMLEIDIDLTDDNQNRSRGIIFDDDKNGLKQPHLRTCDIVNALTKNGYTGSNRVDLIIEDLCLGASIEEAYGLQGMAQYFISSPKVTKGNSIGYYHFITN